jgi:hypothetical protein
MCANFDRNLPQIREYYFDVFFLYTCSSCKLRATIFSLLYLPMRLKTRYWTAASSEDTELGVTMGPEVGHGETTIYITREFKLEAVRLIKERGVSYEQGAQDRGVHQSVLHTPRGCGVK